MTPIQIATVVGLSIAAVAFVLTLAVVMRREPLGPKIVFGVAAFGAAALLSYFLVHI